MRYVVGQRLPKIPLLNPCTHYSEEEAHESLRVSHKLDDESG